MQGTKPSPGRKNAGHSHTGRFQILSAAVLVLAAVTGCLPRGDADVEVGPTPAPATSPTPTLPAPSATPTTTPEALVEASPTPLIDLPPGARPLDGPQIAYNGIRFHLDPTLGARVYVFDEQLAGPDGQTAAYTRFALVPEEACRTWCLQVYPVAQFEAAFGHFVFPPSGYGGGAAVILSAREQPVTFDGGSGERALQAFGQMSYYVGNASLKYVLRGYTTDGAYAVYLQAPVHTPSLPDALPTLPAGGDPVEAILAYNRDLAAKLEGLPDGDFTPALTLLDALAASLWVEAP